jgi:hypothetical protein
LGQDVKIVSGCICENCFAKGSKMKKKLMYNTTIGPTYLAKLAQHFARPVHRIIGLEFSGQQPCKSPQAYHWVVWTQPLTWGQPSPSGRKSTGRIHARGTSGQDGSDAGRKEAGVRSSRRSPSPVSPISPAPPPANR